MSLRAARTVHLSTCAWGRWHVEMLGHIMWPTVLAAGNLPELARRYPLTYRLCTTAADRARIETMPSFAAIAELVPVEFVTDFLGDTPDIALHMQWYRDEHGYALEHDAIYMSLWPDVVFTANTLAHAADALDRGKAGAVLPTLRVASETCVPELVARPRSAHRHALELDSGDAVRLAVQHLHPLSAATLASSHHGAPGVSMIFHVPGEGLIARSAVTWLFMDPRVIRFSPEGDVTTTDANPGSLIHIAADSDDMFFLSMAPLAKDLASFIPDHSNDAMDIARMTMHPALASSPFYPCFERVAAKLHYGSMTTARWSEAEQRSERVVQNVAALRSYLQVWRAAKEHGCARAAQVMSLVLHTTPLARQLPHNGAYTFLIPSDRAFDSAPPSWIERQLDRADRKSLARAALEHTVIGSSALPGSGEARLQTAAGTAHTVRGDRGRHQIDDIPVLEEFVAHGHRICVVDGFLHRKGDTRR